MMSTEQHTALPYIFDLIFDLKTVEQAHDHLLGKTRYSFAGTDRDLVDKMVEHGIPLPEGYEPPAFAGVPLEDMLTHYRELLECVRQMHEHAKKPSTGDAAPMDRSWVFKCTGNVLARQPGLPEAERLAYELPDQAPVQEDKEPR